MWGITMYDPIGWTRDDGIDFDHLIKYNDFHDRMLESHCKYDATKVPDPKE
jgi:hypothetical protein